MHGKRLSAAPCVQVVRGPTPVVARALLRPARERTGRPDPICPCWPATRPRAPTSEEVRGPRSFMGPLTKAKDEQILSPPEVNPITGKPDPNRKDVWWSEDGELWHELPGTPWDRRHASSVFVFGDSLWIASGNTNDHVDLKPDVWRLRRDTAISKL